MPLFYMGLNWIGVKGLYLHTCHTLILSDTLTGTDWRWWSDCSIHVHYEQSNITEATFLIPPYNPVNEQVKC